MHDSHEPELHKLERITSLEPLAPDEKDPETVLLRESWSRFTELLGAADEEWDSRAFASKIGRPRPAGWQRRLVLCGALAASLLVCALAAWLRTPRPNDRPTLRDAPVAQVVQPRQQLSTPTTPNPSPTTSHEELAWDDTLDERLESLHGALATVRGSTFTNDSRLSVLGSRLQQMATEIEASSL